MRCFFLPKTQSNRLFLYSESAFSCEVQQSEAVMLTVRGDEGDVMMFEYQLYLRNNIYLPFSIYCNCSNNAVSTTILNTFFSTYMGAFYALMCVHTMCSTRLPRPRHQNDKINFPT